MTGNPIAWFEIYVRDLERAQRFYEAVFQVTLQPLTAPFPGIAMLAFPSDRERYGATGALVKMDEGCPSGNGTLVYFSCEDCAVEASRVVAAGGLIHRAKFPIGQYGHIALLQDTEGNLVGLHSMA
jgi:predicted enzyme related to lactoylglutathione lyase